MVALDFRHKAYGFSQKTSHFIPLPTWQNIHFIRELSLFWPSFGVFLPPFYFCSSPHNVKFFPLRSWPRPLFGPSLHISNRYTLNLNKPETIYIRMPNTSVPGKFQSVPRPGTILAFIFSTVARNRVIARLLGVTRIIVPGSRPKARQAGTLEIWVARIAALCTCCVLDMG